MGHSKQAELPLSRGSHGGRRPGAGRKPGANPRVRHLGRPDFPARFPCHVTLKAQPGLPSLRSGRVVNAVIETLRAGAERGSFRLLEFSLQDDHLHAIVEADGPAALGRGMKSLASRFAKAVNRAVPRAARVDPASSGAWFLGWRPDMRLPQAIGPPPVARATTWLARVGWQRLGLLDPAEVGGAARARLHARS